MPQTILLSVIAVPTSSYLLYLAEVANLITLFFNFINSNIFSNSTDSNHNFVNGFDWQAAYLLHSIIPE